MQTRRNFLSLTAMAAVATALPSVADPRPNKGKYQVVLLGRDENGRVTEEEHFFFDSPPADRIKTNIYQTSLGECKIYRITAPRRRRLVARCFRSNFIFSWKGDWVTEFVTQSIRYDQRILGETPRA